MTKRNSAAVIGLLDQLTWNAARSLRRLQLVIERRKKCRTIIPDSEIWREAGILSGILARL